MSCKENPEERCISAIRAPVLSWQNKKSAFPSTCGRAFLWKQFKRSSIYLSLLNEQKIPALLGFARKAGKLLLGRSAVAAAVRSEKILLILLAADAPEDLMDKVIGAHLRPTVIRLSALHKKELGELLGHKDVAILGICDRQFAQALSGGAISDRSESDAATKHTIKVIPRHNKPQIVPRKYIRPKTNKGRESGHEESRQRRRH